MRRLDQLCVVGRKRLRELVLFPLLKQEHIELLLDPLEPFNRKKIFRLRRIGSDLAISLIFCDLKICQCRLHHSQLTVHGDQQRLAHRADLPVILHDPRVLEGGVGKVVIPFHQRAVVLCDSPLY